MKSIRRWLMSALAACLVAFGCGIGPQVSAASTQPNQPKAIYKVDTKEKVVALTFDISWGNKVPEPVLNVLKQQNVKKATFFLSGPWTLHHPEIAKKIKDMGYEIGNHGNLHKDFSNYPDSWIREQVALSEKSIYQVTGVKTKLIRTPNGDFNPRVLRCLNNMGYTVIQWNTDSLDWKNPGVQNIVSRVTKRVVPGDIILMHASDSSKQIVEALPQIITQLRNQGYQFVTVSELLAGAKVSSNVR
ncbi:polysaccharide deacetylase family sporulation protein PdaB [Alicyclobacillus hesperidum subsp. aegles]|uniref:polysaccharide deacetylase family sporulation protein PdaB n=1 Tax=Alicyclobacillus hesperidum TaxID=89784 RepID=UPI0007192D07|nr:polysaccharide deacetylase family sporulation protein PdaB [Alicyclobacillus hesperidum]KRW91214.1 polysaccharide deacetylase [Alicyclobacillus tengchongensis]GLG02632.1 polysaccharide deacetylase family sporulation protein PdaB [Alicyclobacillus hesperidum subsp. aegles]